MHYRTAVMLMYFGREKGEIEYPSIMGWVGYIIGFILLSFAAGALGVTRVLALPTVAMVLIVIFIVIELVFKRLISRSARQGPGTGL